jgi:hypothetical protein
MASGLNLTVEPERMSDFDLMVASGRISGLNLTVASGSGFLSVFWRLSLLSGLSVMLGFLLVPLS